MVSVNKVFIQMRKSILLEDWMQMITDRNCPVYL